MADFIINRDADVRCVHLGVATPVAPSQRVHVADNALIVIQSMYSIACYPSGSSTPCATGSFYRGAMRVSSEGLPVALVVPNSSVCIPTGTPMIVSRWQTRVVAK